MPFRDVELTSAAFDRKAAVGLALAVLAGAVAALFVEPLANWSTVGVAAVGLWRREQTRQAGGGPVPEIGTGPGMRRWAPVAPATRRFRTEATRTTTDGRDEPRNRRDGLD